MMASEEQRRFGIGARLHRLRAHAGRLWSLTTPVSEETRLALDARWASLPEHARTDSQVLGRHAVGCEGTHGVFPRCNFACTPCYHSSEANKVRVDGAHTIAEVTAQMEFLRQVHGPHAHAQLIGGEVSLLDPDDHAAALLAMRANGREPMSFTHGDFEYEYLERLVLDGEGNPRLKRISFAAHFDTTMRGRRGLRKTEDESDLDPYRARFAEMFVRLRQEHGTRSYLAHNMTVTPSNVGQIPEVIRGSVRAGYSMFSFQPAAYVGNEARWQDGFEMLDPDVIWGLIEEGAGSPLPYLGIQTGDVRCNRTAFGFYLGDTWYPVMDPDDPADVRARDLFYRHLGGVHFNAPPYLLIPRLLRVLVAHPVLLPESVGWLRRQVRRVGGLRSLRGRAFRVMTFVMHRFMHAADVAPAWELMQRGVTAEDPRIRETQERLSACIYSMAHPETGELVPACVQHGVLDPGENLALRELLPLPRRRIRESTVRGAEQNHG